MSHKGLFAVKYKIQQGGHLLEIVLGRDAERTVRAAVGRGVVLVAHIGRYELCRMALLCGGSGLVGIGSARKRAEPAAVLLLGR